MSLTGEVSGVLECNLCGKTFESWRGARGHMLFSSGDHDKKGDLPDDWRSDFNRAGTDDDTPANTLGKDRDELGDGGRDLDETDPTELSDEAAKDADSGDGFIRSLLEKMREP